MHRIYGDRDSDGFTDMAVGRIFSLTTSDVSAYIARDLFLDELSKSDSFAFLFKSSGTLWEFKTEAKSAARIMRRAGLTDTSVYTDELYPDLDPPGEGPHVLDIERDLSDKVFIAYLDHANLIGWGCDNICSGNIQREGLKMAPSIVISDGCLTCAYTASVAAQESQNLFCTNMIRHGAMAHVGAIRSGGSRVQTVSILTTESLKGKDIGNAFLKYTQMHEADNKTKKDISPGSASNPTYFVLLGDPTLRLLPASPDVEEISTTEESVSSTKTIIRIEVNQPTDEAQYTDSGINNGFYLSPSSESYAAGNKWIRSAPNSAFKPAFEDVLYIERGTANLIANVAFRVRYSDGSEESYDLVRTGNSFTGWTSRTCLRCRDIIVSPHRVAGKNMLYVKFHKEETGFDMSRLIPSYVYEIELDLVKIRTRPLFYRYRS